jgi:TolA-binding protein
MSKPSEALLKLRVLGAPIDHQTPTERVQLIERINQVAHEERLRKSKQKQVFWLSSAAALLLVLGGLALWSETPSSERFFQSTSATHAATPQAESTQGSPANHPTTQRSPTKATSANQRTASLASGTQLRVNAEASYEVELSKRDGHSDELILLKAGLVTFKVPALGQETVSVKTPDALVVVHGTEFSVHVTARDGRSSTRVEVMEGLVSVRSGEFHEYLRPGASWTSPFANSANKERTNPAATGANQNAPTSPAVLDPQKSTSLRVAPAQITPESADAGTLALENAIYARAMKFKLAGDYPAAREALSELIETYPNSPLVPSARKAQVKFHEIEDQGRK